MVQIQLWAARLAERFRGSSPWFARLIAQLPAERRLVTPFEAVLEVGPIWFRYNAYRSGEMGEAMLELSLTVPYPDREGAPAADGDPEVDAAIEALTRGWWERGWLDSYHWKEEKGQLGALLALEFQALDASADKLREIQEALLSTLRALGCMEVRRYLRSSADFEIFYSELTGNTISRSVSMKSAFDIVRGRYRSAAAVTIEDDHEDMTTQEEFESLFEAGKDDIQMPELTFDGVADEIREIRLGLPRSVQIKVRTERREKHIKAIVTGREEAPIVFCLTWSDDRWWTYYEDNGVLTDVCAFENEADACDYYLRFLEEDAYGDTPPPTYEEIDGEDVYDDGWYDDWDG